MWLDRGGEDEAGDMGRGQIRQGSPGHDEEFGFYSNVPENLYILEQRDDLEDFLPRAPTREEVFNCQKSPSRR